MIGLAPPVGQYAAKDLHHLAAAVGCGAHKASNALDRRRQHPVLEGRINAQNTALDARGGLTTKIHALVDANGLPIRPKLSEGQAQDRKSAGDMLDGSVDVQVLLADR